MTIEGMATSGGSIEDAVVVEADAKPAVMAIVLYKGICI